MKRGLFFAAAICCLALSACGEKAGTGDGESSKEPGTEEAVGIESYTFTDDLGR